MRNLKRALSLALASVMLLGMMVVGTSAASYPDVDENDNVEAIEVLNAVNVMIGRQGNFEPDELVNRHEMAVIMAKLVLGVDTADNYVGSHPFTDVVPWADKYVAACYENDLISGTSATTYSGSQPLTAVQAALMMLRALGYKDLNKGATDWRAPITAMANQIRLFDGVASNPNDKLNRNQVAQLALNTLKSPMVNLKDNTISWTNGDGQIIISGGSREYIVLSSREAYARAINRVESEGTSASAIGGWTVELGEHLYNGKLRLDDDTDVFLRPARTWQYDGEKIGTYVKEELLRETYSTEVTGKTLYNLLTKNTVDHYDFTIAIDGVEATEANYDVLNGYGYFTEGNLVNTNTRGVGATGKGVTTEVYVDSVNEEVTIAVINTYLAKASENYNEKRDEVRFNIWAVDAKDYGKILVKDKTVNTIRTVSAEDFGDTVKDFKKNDIVLVRVADNEIQEIIQPEVIDKTVLSSFSKGSWVNNGTKYDYANTAKYDAGVLDVYDLKNMQRVTYNLYLDGYGYMIGIERNEDPDQYVFLTGIDAGDSNLRVSTADANVIHVDGTMKTVKVDMKESVLPSYGSKIKNNSQLNTWCTYSVSNSGVYTLEEVKDNAGANNLGQFAQDVDIYDNTNDGETDKKTITEKRTSLVASINADKSVKSWVYGNDDTKYINVELEDVVVKDKTGDDNYTPIAADHRWIIDDVDTVITGIKDVDLEMTNLTTVKDGYINPKAEIYTLYKEGIVIAAVTIGDDMGSAATWAYITSEEPRQEDYYHETDSTKAAQPGEWTWYREAIVDGKIVDLIEVGDKLNCIGKYNPDTEKGMQQGEWYEVKLNADGNVRKAQPLSVALAGTGRYVTTSKGVEPALNANSGDVVLHMTFDENAYKADPDHYDDLSFKNGNLYTYWNDPKGFSVNRSVNVALGQAQIKKGYTDTLANHGVNVDEWKYKDDTFEGYDGVKAAIDRLDANFVGDLNVVFHNGAATVVIINDTWGEFINEGNNGNNGSSKAISLTREANGEWTLTVPYATTNAQMSDPDMIRAWLTNRECTNIEAAYGGTWTFWYNGHQYRYQTVNVVRETPPTEYTATIVVVGGTANVSAITDKKDAQVKFTVTPDPDYEFKSIDADYVTRSGNEFSFKMPAADTTITVTYTKEGDIQLNELAGAAVLKDGAKVTSVSIGETYSVNPAKAVELKGTGVDSSDAANGNYKIIGEDVTLAAKNGWVYMEEGAWKGMWLGEKENGDPDFSKPYVGLAGFMFRSMLRSAVITSTVDVTEEGCVAAFLMDDTIPVGSVLEMYADAEHIVYVVKTDDGLIIGTKGSAGFIASVTAFDAAAEKKGGVVPGVTAASEAITAEDENGTLTDITLDLGEPIVGAILPETITVDEKVTVTLKWWDEADTEKTDLAGEIAEEGVTYAYSWTKLEAEEGYTVDAGNTKVDDAAVKTDENGNGVPAEDDNTESDLPVVVVGEGTITAYWYNEDKTVTEPTEKDLKRIETEICSDEAFAEAEDIRCGNLDVGSVIVDGVSYAVTFVRCYTITVGETTVYAYGSSALISDEDAETFVGTNFVTEDPNKVVYEAAVTFETPVDGVSAMAGLTFGAGEGQKAENVTLTAAYELACAADTIYAGTSYDDAAVATSGNYVADKATLYVEFSTEADNQFARLNATVDDKPVMVVEKAYAETETGNRVEFTIDAAKYLDAETNVITLAIVNGYKLIIDDGSATGIDLGLWDGEAKTDANALTIDYTDTLKKDMSLVVLVADDDGTPVAVDHKAVGENDSITVAINTVDTAGGTNGWKFSITGDVATNLAATADEGVITLSRAWVVTLGADAAATVTVGEETDPIDFATDTNGHYVKVGTAVTVETEKTAGLCIAADAGDGAEVLTDCGMATAEAAATFEGELTADTEFSTLIGTASLTVEKVNDLVNNANATTVAAIVLKTEDQAVADKAVEVFKKTGEADEAKVESDVKITTNDSVRVVVTLTAKTGHTLAFLDEVVVDGFADDKCTVAITDGDAGAKVATITFTAAAAKTEYAPAEA